MKSLQRPEHIAFQKKCSVNHRQVCLSSIIGLSAGAISWSNLASANDEGRDLQTLILPDTYSALDDGTVTLQLETGEQLTLTADQYVMLDGGLLLVVDELAQNSVAELPILGSLRTQLFTEVQPVRSPDDSIVEANNQQPLWSGEGPAPRLFEEIDIERFEIAQDQQGEDENDEVLFLSGAGATLIGIGITALGMMNSGADGNDDDERTDGGGSTNQPPIITSTPPATVAENTVASFYTLTATDPDLDTVTYSISGGADESSFELENGDQLKFKSSAVPNFELPGSADNDLDYSVQIEARDGNGGTATQTVSITVTNVNENPVLTSGTSANFAENGTGTVYTAAATDVDGDTPTYHLIGGADQALFDLDSSSGALTFKSEPNYEDPKDASLPSDNVYEVQIEARDGNGGTATQTVSITVTNVNENPVLTSGTSANFAENGTGTAYTAAATDVDGDTPTYHLIGGADQALFDLDSSSGALTFKSEPNYEDPKDASLPSDNVHEVQIEARDGNGGTATQTVSITVTNVNENPVLTSGTSANFAENGTGTAYTAAATDVDGDTPTYHLIGGADQALFDLDSSSGALTFKSEPNYEDPKDASLPSDNVYEVQIEARDGNGGTATQTVSITVTNVNENPVLTSGTSANFAENGTGTAYTAAATDVDGDTPTYHLIGGADQALFDLDSSSGALTFKSEPNYEDPKDASLPSDNVHEVQIEARDGNGGTATQTVSITVTNVNENPVLTSTPPANVDEGTSASFYTLTATDPDAGDTIAFTISGGVDALKFELDGSNGLKFKAAPDYDIPGDNDSDNDYHVEITASDGNGGTDVQQVTVAVNEVVPPALFSAVRLDGIDEFDASGKSVSSAGDVNGDGFDDILISATEADFGDDRGVGETYLVFGSYLATDPGTVDLSDLTGKGVRLDGIAHNDKSGWSISSAGDVDADGLDDILIGAQGANGSAGATYLVFGSYLATNPGTVDLGNLGANGVRLDGIDANDKSGASVSSAGDVDDDGKDDILIGAFQADPNASSESGETYLVFGSYLATNPGTVDLDNLGANGVRLDGSVASDFSGWSISSAGDVDGDDKDDILIGASQADPNGSKSGETYLVFGSYLATNPGTVDLGNLGANGVRLEGIDASDKSGSSVSSAGDVDADGLDDILIGAFQADPNGSNSGETYLVFGSYLATNPGTVDLDNLGANGVRLDGIDAYDTSGASISSAGDVDGDGFYDILIGAKGGDNRAGSSGETYLVFGSYLATNPGTVDLDNYGANVVRLDGIDAGDASGASISSAGDVDGDGRDDILIGAYQADPGAATNSGETYLISGETLDLAADGIGVATAGVIDLVADLGLG